METSININKSLKIYDRDSLTLEKNVENGDLSILEEKSFNVWTIWFNDEMIIFNITDDAKQNFKEYIKMNDKIITQWMVYKNIMANRWYIFITQMDGTSLKTFVK